MNQRAKQHQYEVERMLLFQIQIKQHAQEETNNQRLPHSGKDVCQKQRGICDKKRCNFQRTVFLDK